MSLTGPTPTTRTRVGVPDRRPARRHVRRVRRASPRCTSATAPGGGRVVRTRCSPRSSACTPSRAPGTPSPARCRTRQGNHHPSIAPYGLFRCADGMVQIAVRQRGPVAQVRRRVRPRPRRRRGWPPTRERVGNRDAVDRSRRRRLRRPPAGRAARPAGRGRRPRGRGPHPRPGLRLGADPLPGPGHRRRPPGARPDRAARPAAALRRQRARRRPHRAPAPAGAGRARRVGARLARRDGRRHRRGPAVSTPPGRRPRADRHRARRGQLAELGRSAVAGGRAGQPLRRRAGGGRRQGRHGRVRSSPAPAPCRGAGSPWSSASSASSPGRSARARRSGWSSPSSAPPARGCRCSPRRPRAAPACRRAPAPSCSMVKISAAIAAHKAAGLPYLVYLRHPTTGGVFASWGSLGHVTVAEPGALVGFLGPRVYEALYDAPFPPGVQTSENLYEHGLLDAVLPIEALAEVAARALNVLMAPREGLPVVPELPRESLPDLHAWESITRSRRPERPGVRALLKLGASDVVPAARHRPGRAGPRAADRPGPLRRRPVRGARPGPPAPDDGPPARAGRPARGPARHAARPRAQAAPGQRHRHRRRRAVQGGRGGRAGRRDRPVPRRAGDARRAHGLRPARPGHRRRGARADARRPRDLRPARLAVAAAARGRLGDPAPRHRPRARAGRLPGGALARPAAGRRRRPDRGRAPRRGGRAGRLLRPDGPGAGARARAAAADRPGHPAGRPGWRGTARWDEARRPGRVR